MHSRVSPIAQHRLTATGTRAKQGASTVSSHGRNGDAVGSHDAGQSFDRPQADNKSPDTGGVCDFLPTVFGGLDTVTEIDSGQEESHDDLSSSSSSSTSSPPVHDSAGAGSAAPSGSASATAAAAAPPPPAPPAAAAAAAAAPRPAVASTATEDTRSGASDGSAAVDSDDARDTDPEPPRGVCASSALQPDGDMPRTSPSHAEATWSTAKLKVSAELCVRVRACVRVCSKHRHDAVAAAAQDEIAHIDDELRATHAYIARLQDRRARLQRHLEVQAD